MLYPFLVVPYFNYITSFNHSQLEKSDEPKKSDDEPVCRPRNILGHSTSSYISISVNPKSIS